MFKKILLMLVMFTCLLSGCGKKEEPIIDDLQTIKNRGKLLVGVRSDTKPFGYYNKEGQLVGLDIDLAKKIAGRILDDESKIEFVVLDASDRISALNTKKVDMLVATMSITQQRLRVVDFSEAYFVAGQAVMVQAKSPFTSFNELDDKRLVVVYGTTAEKSLRDVYPTANILAYKTYQEAFSALKRGDADAIVADDVVLLGYSLDDKSVRLLAKRYSREPYGIAFRQGEESLAFQALVNELINGMRSTGAMQRLLERHNLL